MTRKVPNAGGHHVDRLAHSDGSVAHRGLDSGVHKTEGHMLTKNAGRDGERGLDVAELAVVVVRVDDLRGPEARAGEVAHACGGRFEL